MSQMTTTRTATSDMLTSGSLVVHQYDLACLSQLSYLVGDRTTGKAAVIDPRRDVAEYLADAEALGLSIEWVIETHFHADFLSGHLELADATGATIVFGEGPETEFASTRMGDGDRIELGDVSIEVLATPGHTPESISLVVRDASAGADPVAVLTGDTLFIGDVGRPDLLASFGHTADDLAAMLYSSVRDKLLDLPDDTYVLPAHGAGSACGKSLSTATVSTIGEQRRTNYALAPMPLETFKDLVTEGQPAAPAYFGYAATKNRQGRELLEDDEAPPAMSAAEVLAAQADGAAVIDTRDAPVFAAGHLAGAVNVGLGGRFAETVGSVVDPSTPIVLVGDPGSEGEARVRLARIGFDKVVGHLEGGEEALATREDVVRRSSRLTVPAFETARRELADLQIVDVRNPGETEAGHLDEAQLIPLAQLRSRIDELDPARPTVVHCAGGYRSSVAASLLEANGFTDVSDLLGGWTALVGAEGCATS